MRSLESAGVRPQVVSGQVPGQVIVDAGTKALSREDDQELGFGRVGPPDRSVLDGLALSRLNEYHGYLAARRHTPSTAGTVLPVVPTMSAPW